MAEQTPNPYRLSLEQMSELRRLPQVLQLVKACNADARDEISISRVGHEGCGLVGRAFLYVREGGRSSRIFVSAPEARQLAAALLNVADELDGAAPLVFFDPSGPSAEEPPQADRGRE